MMMMSKERCYAGRERGRGRKGGERGEEEGEKWLKFILNEFTNLYLDSECWRSWRWECHTVRMELLDGNNIATSQSHHAMVGHNPMIVCIHTSVCVCVCVRVCVCVCVAYRIPTLANLDIIALTEMSMIVTQHRGAPPPAHLRQD